MLMVADFRGHGVVALLPRDETELCVSKGGSLGEDKCFFLFLFLEDATLSLPNSYLLGSRWAKRRQRRHWIAVFAE